MIIEIGVSGMVGFVSCSASSAGVGAGCELGDAEGEGVTVPLAPAE